MFSFIDYSKRNLVTEIYKFLIALISLDSSDSFVAVRHPKTAFNLLKHMEHSNIITQKLETIKKINNFNIESVTIEHPKTATKLSRFIKKPKINNQKNKSLYRIKSP